MIYLISILLIIGVSFFYKNSTPSLSSPKKAILIILRSTYIIILCILLFNPILRYTSKTRIDDKVIILVDDSESMDIVISEQKKTDLFKQINNDLTKILNSKNIDFQAFKLSDFNQLKKKSSYIMPFFEYIKEKNTYRNTKAIYLLSDGWIHDESLQSLSSFDIPIYTFNLDISEHTKDLKIDDLKFNKTAYQNELSTINLRISSENLNTKANVQLIIENKIVQEKTISIQDKQSIEIDFDVVLNKIGLLPFSVTVNSADDTYFDNNTMSGAIQVVESKQKIAIISDILNHDLTYISQLFHNSKRYSLDIFFYKNRQFYQANQRSEPKIKEYSSLIIINSGTLSINQAMKNDIAQLMEDGFGLISIGLPINGLEEIQPVAYSNIKNLYRGNFRVSAIAEQYKIFEELNENIQNTPIVNYYYLSLANQANTLSFIENESMSPWIVYRTYLNSHIFHICGFDIWKWKSYTANNDYDNFFNGLIDWISRKNSERFYAFTDRNSYLYGEKVIVKLNAYDERFYPLTNISPNIIIKQNEKAIKEDFMPYIDNQYQIELSSLKPGTYTYQVTENEKHLKTTGTFIISDMDKELYETGINTNMLAMISNLSKGNYIKPADIINHIPKLQEKQFIKKIIEYQFYKKWQFVLLFLLSISCEYFLRKRWGLI
ncbi:MAG: hypothetical protein RBS16_00510 [Candidatus Cloacimonadales bacterium]|jgi:hypothetical protein|nr:hypothetical protein [Candidatus Cloacimonadales bacterium]